MPGFATHYFFGQQAVQSVTSQKHRNRLCRYMHSFCLGLQGPDVFYYSFPAYLSSNGNIGSTLHSQSTLHFFTAMMNMRDRFADKESRKIADAYICGFIGHYTLDTYCHPYVFCRTKHLQNQNRSLYDFGRHVFLETAMDQEVIRHFNNTEPSAFQPENTIRLSLKEQHVIGSLLHHAIAEAFPERKVSYFQCRFAIFSMRLESWLMHDPTNWKKIFLRRIEQKLFGYAVISPMIPSNTVSIYKDPCNLSHRRWANPWNPRYRSTESVYDLMDRAIPVFCQRMDLYFHSYSSADRDLSRTRSEQFCHAQNLLWADLGDCSYNSGLPLK